MTGVEYPPLYDRFISVIDLVNLNLGYIFSLACVLDTDYHDRILFATIGPMVVLAILAGIYAVARRRNLGSTVSMRAVKRKHISIALFVLFLVYSSVAHTIFEAFVCDKLDDGVTYLRADYRLTCTSDRHRAFMAYAVVMAIVYPIGIPVAFSLWLFRHREVLSSRTKEMALPKEVHSFRDLWEPYKPRHFYYEIVEYARRVVLTGISAFIYPGTSAQIAIVLFLAVSFALLTEVLSPFEEILDTWLYRAGACVVSLSMYMALLLKVDVSEENSDSQEMFSTLLIALQVGIALAVVLQPLCWSSTPTGRVLEQELPRLRPNTTRSTIAGADAFSVCSESETEVDSYKSSAKQGRGRTSPGVVEFYNQKIVREA